MTLYHLHVHDGRGVLPQWYDAFHDPFYVGKRVPRELLEAFCRELKTSWKETQGPPEHEE